MRRTSSGGAFRLARRPVAGLQAFAWGQERAVPEPTYGRSLRPIFCNRTPKSWACSPSASSLPLRFASALWPSVVPSRPQPLKMYQQILRLRQFWRIASAPTAARRAPRRHERARRKPPSGGPGRPFRGRRVDAPAEGETAVLGRYATTPSASGGEENAGGRRSATLCLTADRRASQAGR